jgi:hypothetical protein
MTTQTKSQGRFSKEKAFGCKVSGDTGDNAEEY